MGFIQNVDMWSGVSVFQALKLQRFSLLSCAPSLKQVMQAAPGFKSLTFAK